MEIVGGGGVGTGVGVGLGQLGGFVDPVEPVEPGGTLVWPESVPPDVPEDVPEDGELGDVGSVDCPEEDPLSGGVVPVPEPGIGVVVHAAITASSPVAPSFRKYVMT